MLHFKSYFKFLCRNKLYSLVNVVGLSASLMFVILIASYAVNELQTDAFQENADQIYIMCNEERAGSAYQIGGILKYRYPEIEQVCAVTWVSYSGDIPIEIADSKLNATIMATDSTLLDMFSFKILSGDRANLLTTQQEMVISESFARKAFGNQDPIGRAIILKDSLSYTVSGVIEDFKNSIFKSPDIIMGSEVMIHFNPSVISDSFGNAGASEIFIRSSQGDNLKAKEDEIVDFLKTFFWVYQQDIYKKVDFMPIREFYFSDKNSSHNLNSNDKTMLTVLVLIAMLILTFAIINYINLTVAQTGFRAKEMSARRLFGASSSGLFMKMILESTLLCFVAFSIALFLAFFIEPHANRLINIDILLSSNFTIGWGIMSAIFVVMLGVISGIIPAIIISKFKPIDIVKGSFTFKSKMVFSKVFITIQSVITIILIASSLTIYNQVEHLITSDYGYNHKAIIDIPNTSISSHSNQFRDRLRTLPSVKSVGFTMGTPLDRGNNNTANVVGVEGSISFQTLVSDSATIKMFSIEFLKDNNLAQRGYWVNEETLRRLNATDSLSSFKCKGWGSDVKVAGVIKDFHMGDLVSYGGSKTPLLLDIRDNITYPWSILVEIQGDLVSGYRDVENVFKEFSDGLEFNGAYIDQSIEQIYSEQRRIQTIMVLFSIVAILISSLGLLAISSYFIQQRSREIAVRKVFGSTTRQVLTKIIWEFMRLVVVAFFIGAPIVWYMMDRWLSEFPHRIDMSIGILLTAGLFNLLIALLTIYWQSSVAANTNPTKSMMK